MTPSNPASGTNEALADVDDFLRRLRHVDPDILIWIRSLLAERAATERAIGAAETVPSLDLLTEAYRAAFWVAVPASQARQRAERMHAYLIERLASETPRPGEEQEIEAALGRRIWPGRLSQPGGSDAE